MWPYPTDIYSPPTFAWAMLDWLRHEPRSWPGRAAPLAVATWAKEPLEAVSPESAGLLLAAARDGSMPTTTFWWWEAPTEGPALPSARRVMSLSSAGLALLYLAKEDVCADLKRSAIAVDAGRTHHEILSTWRELPKTRGHEYDALHDGTQYTLKLLIPNEQKQLVLSFAEIHEALLQRLREWQGFEGIRHWTAFLCQLSTIGGRTGWVRWTMQQHLDTLGYSERSRRDPYVLDTCAGLIELMTQMELVIYEQSGAVRERRPLIIIGNRFERLIESKWRLDGMELQINPLLYRGVRNDQTSELGMNWFPAPTELVQVDHKHHPYTQTLGILLPIRWRWAWKDGKDHITLSGDSLLRLAGITPRRRKLGESWDKLERDLLELQRVNGIGRWEWHGPPGMKTMCTLYPAAWMLDRTLRGLKPVEAPPAPPVLTGTDLKAWRKAKLLRVEEAAEHLGVGVATIKRAEAQPARQVGHALQKALSRIREAL